MYIRNVWEYLENTERVYGDKVALEDREKSITFTELYQKAKQIGSYINNFLNGEINQSVAVYMPKGVDAICCFFGIVYSGNYYTPLDYNSPVERIISVCQVLQPAIIIFNDDNRCLNTNGHRILLSECESYSENVPIPPWENVLDVDPLYVLFTSGSTGVPKGVIINHRSVIDYTEWLKETFHFDNSTVFGNQAPFYFDNSVLDIYTTICNGSRMVIIPESYFAFPVKLLEFLDARNVNTLFWVPSALVNLANSDQLKHHKLESLRQILFCGEVMPNKQLNIWRSEYPDVQFANLYGPTEITDVCSYYIVDRKFEDDEPLPIGRACKNTDILVLNDKNELVKNGEVGELCVRGICLSRGYLGDYEKTDKAFVQNPLNSKYYEKIYRTGDLVKYNEYNEIIFICRKDFQIKHNGYRIELGEIESAVSAIPGILGNCAIYDDAKKKIILFCASTGEISEKDIYQAAKKKIPKYMMPDSIRILTELPQNANGKIDRNKLKVMVREENV